MPFYDFRQNNSGGSFHIAEGSGISVHVIVEADDVNEANARAENIGLYFDGCDTGQDCSCCGDRWSPAYGAGSPVPSLYDGGDEITPGELFPAADDPTNGMATKWSAEGVPEGFIHYKDGRVESFWSDTAARQDLDGSFGYGVNYYRSWDEPTVFMTTSNGYAEDGNRGPAAGKQVKGKDDLFAKWEKPDKATVKVERLYNGERMLRAWFPTEDEALALAVKITEAKAKANAAFLAALEEIVADDTLRGDIPKRQFRSIVELWKP